MLFRSHRQQSLALAEGIYKARPDSAQAARDVWVSCWKLAQLAEATGKGDAQAWWRRAHGILAGMKQKGMFLSPQDEQVLEELGAKVGR